MITLEKLKIFANYKGDIDLWARSHRPSDKIISGVEWSLIDDFIQDVILINGSNASSLEYKVKFDKKIAENLDSEEAVLFLKTFLKKQN